MAPKADGLVGRVEALEAENVALKTAIAEIREQLAMEHGR